MSSTHESQQDKKNKANQPVRLANIPMPALQSQPTGAVQRAKSSGLQPADIVALQRTVGNQGVQRLLESGGQEPSLVNQNTRQGASTDPVLQRLTVQSTQWEDVGNKERTMGSVGAVIMHDKDMDKPKVVVKYVPIQEQVVKSHLDLKERMGVERTPGSRGITGQERQTVESLIADVPDKGGQASLKSQMVDQNKELIVMEFVAGTAAEELMEETAPAQAVGPRFFHELGKIIVYDQLTGNHDRIKVNTLGGNPLSVNMQNLLVSDDGMPIPIDNTARGREGFFAKKKLEKLPSITKEDWAMMFYSSPALGPAFMKDTANFDALQEGLKEGMSLLEKYKQELPNF